MNSHDCHTLFAGGLVVIVIIVKTTI